MTSPVLSQESSVTAVTSEKLCRAEFDYSGGAFSLLVHQSQLITVGEQTIEGQWISQSGTYANFDVAVEKTALLMNISEEKAREHLEWIAALCKKFWATKAQIQAAEIAQAQAQP